MGQHRQKTGDIPDRMGTLSSRTENVQNRMGTLLGRTENAQNKTGTLSGRTENVQNKTGAASGRTENLRRLRVHHVLCIPLYEGYGYGDDFCENMERQIKWLRANPNRALEVVCGPDIICAGCPNLSTWNVCRLSGESVDEKDRRLAADLGIQPGQAYTWRQLLELARARMTERIFIGSCQNCEWYGKKLCSYEKWRQSVEYKNDRQKSFLTKN